MAQKRNILRLVKRRARAALWERFGYPVLKNVNGTTGDPRRALLVYLAEPFVIDRDDPRFLEHQNLRQCMQIAAALGTAGYSVDVADFRHRMFRPRQRYDLVVSHRVDLPDPDGMLDASVRVYLATGKNHFVHNRNVRQRYQAARERRGCFLEPPPPNPEVLPFVRRAHAIAGFGNVESVSTWLDIVNVPIFPFNNYGFASTRSTIEGKDFCRARTRFLFFASRDQIAKGLDRLLEIFSRNTGLELFVCSAFKKEESFVRCYERELFRTPNIHALGLIGVNSDRFYELTNRCAFVIHPSCSDATPGSVVQCMHTGMIPIVTSECGMDVGDAGMLLSDDRPASIEGAVVQSAALRPELVKERAEKTRRLALDRYSESGFERRWEEIAKSVALLPGGGVE